MPARTTAHYCIDAALPFRDFARSLQGVRLVTPNQILKVAPSGHRHVKFTDKSGALSLSIRSGGSMRELMIYFEGRQGAEIKLQLARFSRDNDYAISFK